jgi:cytosine/adenosine deaminase-related metal-dependent hydrolase
VHQQQLDILDVADEEGLVAGGGHVASLLVGAEADLNIVTPKSVSKFPLTVFLHNTVSQRRGRNVPRA